MKKEISVQALAESKAKLSLIKQTTYICCPHDKKHSRKAVPVCQKKCLEKCEEYYKKIN